jgi:hypothetical protein
MTTLPAVTVSIENTLLFRKFKRAVVIIFYSLIFLYKQHIITERILRNIIF